MTEEEMKQKMEATWNAAAAKYAEWVIEGHLVQGLFSEFEALLVPALQGQPGARILDVASASGEPAATLAAALPQALVVSTDLAAPYLDLGIARAARLGLPNISFETADAEELNRYPDASFDAVTCSLGLMFMPRYANALAEFRRVLKPGGIFAATVWKKEEEVPFFQVTKQLAGEYDPASLPAAASSTAVRFGDPAELLAATSASGLSDVQCKELQLEFTMPTQGWWREMLEMPLPLKAALTKAQEGRPGEDVFEEARLKLQDTLTQKGWLTGDKSLRIPGNGCWFISAKK